MEGELKRHRTATRNATVLVGSVMVWCGAASATPGCQGTYTAASLRPLPARLVVDLDIRDRSERNLMLADRFLGGVREAGIAVGQDANVLLHVKTSRLGETPSGPSRRAERTYPELGGLAGGGMQPELPPMPATGMRTSRSAPTAPPLLVLRVDATVGKGTAWVASMQCRMTGSDEGGVAQELGRVVGGSLGKRVERQAF
jgi:hypothetical protein